MALRLTRKGWLGIVLVLIVGLAALPFALSPVSPVAVRHAPAVAPGPEYETGYTVLETEGPYPEGLLEEADGAILAGHEDGSVVRIRLDGDGRAVSTERTADLGGHAIGLVRDRDSDTYWSATFPLGLQQVGAEGVINTIGSVDGIPLGFPDDVVQDENGIVYVTDASTRYNPRTTKPGAPYVFWELIEGRANGRLIALDPSTGEAVSLLDDLAFPSGVTLTPDGSALLIVEVSRFRVIRYELKGEERGKVSVFADRLPGFPDDVFLDASGNAWVTLVAPRDPVMENWIGLHPYLSRVLSLLPWSVQNTMLAPGSDGGRVVRLSASGTPDCTLRIPDGPAPANGLWKDGKILLGRLGGTALIAIDPHPCVSVLKGASKEMYETMSEDELEELASTKRKNLPEKKDS